MKIYLRALEVEDYKRINKWRNNPELSQNLAGNFFFVSSERERISLEHKILDDSKNIYLGICDSEDHSLIGFANINNIDLRNLKAEWGGILIGEKEYWGKGYGKEAATKLLRFLFDEYPIHKCYSYCIEGHPTTPFLFKSLGFSNDGILRDEVYKKGKFRNLLLFSVLREEINGNF